MFSLLVLLSVGLMLWVFDVFDGPDEAEDETPVEDDRTITGTDDDDELYGGVANNIMNGGDGDDLLRGGYGNDILNGGDGDDALHGDADSDLLHGGDGNDTLWADTVEEGGDDVLYGDAGDDTLYGGSGADALYGGTGDDVLESGVVYDNNGSLFVDTNRLYGEAGDDTLIGRGMLDGGEGDDTLIAIGILNEDDTTLTGGAGVDGFEVGRFGSEDVYEAERYAATTITDFDPSEESLVVNALVPSVVYSLEQHGDDTWVVLNGTGPSNEGYEMVAAILQNVSVLDIPLDAITLLPRAA